MYQAHVQYKSNLQLFRNNSYLRPSGHKHVTEDIMIKAMEEQTGNDCSMGKPKLHFIQLIN